MRQVFKNISVFIFVLFIAQLASAQDRPIQKSSGQDESILSRCDQKIFTKATRIPSLSVPSLAFSDSIRSYLSGKSVNLTDGTFLLTFIVMKTGGITDLTYLKGPAIPATNTIKDAVRSLQHLWKPAIQAENEVCAYVKLELVFKDGGIATRIYQ